MGLGAAWVYAQRGWEALVIEADKPGAEASSAAAGMLGVAAEWSPQELVHCKIGRASAELWPEFVRRLEDEAALDVGFDRTGTLLVARDRQEVEDLQRRYGWLQEASLASELWSRDALREREPELSPRVIAGLFCPDEHQVDNRKVVQALAIVAERAGAEIRSGVPAKALLSRDGAVRGVELESGELISADRVIIAAGAKASLIGGWPVQPPRIRPIKGQALSLKMPEGALKHVIRAPGAYIVPKPGGRLLIGATQEERGFDKRVTAGAVIRLLDHAWEVLPVVEDWELDELWAGLRPAYIDGMPLVGPSKIDGLWFVAGHYRSGILELPLTLYGIEQMLNGEPPPEALESSLATRWAPTPLAL